MKEIRFSNHILLLSSRVVKISLFILHPLFIYDKKHHKHEDLAFLLEKKHSPKLINRVYDLAVMELDYTKEDEFFNIARKCTYALGYTNTPKAKEKLELLAQNENELIREYAIKQLNRHDFTDKDVEEQD